MNRDETLTVHDITYFTARLLAHADHLPPDLTAMLTDYQQELKDSPPARWNGVGDHAQAEAIAGRIAQSLTDNDPAITARPGDPATNRHAWAQDPATFRSALQILTYQGEITVKDGTYQPRAAP